MGGADTCCCTSEHLSRSQGDFSFLLLRDEGVEQRELLGRLLTLLSLVQLLQQSQQVHSRRVFLNCGRGWEREASVGLGDVDFELVEEVGLGRLAEAGVLVSAGGRGLGGVNVVAVAAGSDLVRRHLAVAQELLTGLARGVPSSALAQQLKQRVLQLQVLHQLLRGCWLSSGVTQRGGAAAKSLSQSGGHLRLAQDALVQTLKRGVAAALLGLTRMTTHR